MDASYAGDAYFPSSNCGAAMETISIRPEVRALILEQVALTGQTPSDVIEEWRRMSSTASAKPSGASTKAGSHSPGNLHEYLESSELQRKRNAIAKYLGILSFLFQQHGNEIQRAMDVSGHRRKYFSTDPEELRRSGVAVNPKKIPGTPYWAISRLSNRDKRVILARVLQQLGYPKGTADPLGAIFRSS
jgi:negative regulator of replication initiation